MKLTRSVMIFTAIVILSGGSVAYAAANLFTQSIPGQTFNTAFEISKCTSLVLDTAMSNVPLAGGSGYLSYDCSTGAAFYASSSSVGPVTPTFTVPTGWTLGVALTENYCTTGYVTNLTSGTPVTLNNPTAGYQYCLVTTSASNFTTFNVAWSQ